MNEITKPEFKWYYGLPFAKIWNKGASDYYKDRQRYDFSFMKDSEKVRYSQGKMIYGIDSLLFFILTTLWTLLPPLIDLPNWLQWMNLGMDDFGLNNWGNQIMLTIIPGISSILIHKAPKILPSKKVRVVIDSILKLLPIIILTICWYLIHTEIQVKAYKKLEKNLKLKELQGL